MKYKLFSVGPYRLLWPYKRGRFIRIEFTGSAFGQRWFFCGVFCVPVIGSVFR